MHICFQHEHGRHLGFSDPILILYCPNQKKH